MNDTKSTKKLYIILTAIILVITAIIVILLTNDNTNKVMISNEESKQLMNTNALTMMYETEAGSGEYQISTDNTWPTEGYTFNERLSDCENGSELTWDNERKAVILSANVSDKCYVYFDKEPTLADLCNGLTLSECITAQVYTGVDGENGLYYHDGVGIYTNADQEAGDNSYRFSGANPNNYVCFGSDDAWCLKDNIYRIIGVFDGKVKLIKNKNYGSFPWDVDGDNTWNATTKPDVYTRLNDAYYNKFETKWQNKIAEHTWQVGGISDANVYSSSVQPAYNYEVGVNQTGYVETMNVGLVYVSDYGYAASPESWTTTLDSYNDVTNTNWLYLGDSDWTISRCPDTTGNVYVNNFSVYEGVYDVYVINYRQVRPSFYLNSNVQYISGTGTESDPFRIA